MEKIIPAKLAAGDEIRVIAPARGIKIIGQDARKIAQERFEAWGLKVTFGRHTTDDNWDMLGSSSVSDRVEDIHEAFADKNVKAIFTIIGGANSNQLLPYLDYELIKANPKVFCLSLIHISEPTRRTPISYAVFCLKKKKKKKNDMEVLVKPKNLDRAKI